MRGAAESESMHMYDTVEHDMRQSKEYMANVKFNFIEVFHKLRFLKKLKGDAPSEEERPEESKEKLQLVKKEAEKIRASIEQISKEIADKKNLLKRKSADLAEKSEKQSALIKRVQEIEEKERIVREFVEIKQENEKVQQRTKRLLEEKSGMKTLKERKSEQIAAKRETAETLRRERGRREERLQLLQKEANQQMVYLYSWYRQFGTVYTRLVGLKVIDVRQSRHRQVQEVYASTEGKSAPEKEEQNSEINVKIISKKDGRAAVLALVFVDGRMESYSVHKTEDSAQTQATNCDELFQYCRKINSNKFFVFESINQQMK